MSFLLQVQAYLQNLPQSFANVEFLKESFGNDVNKILDTLDKATAIGSMGKCNFIYIYLFIYHIYIYIFIYLPHILDMIVPITVALSIRNPNFEQALKSHEISLPLYLQSAFR
jgi:hypothetical protein